MYPCLVGTYLSTGALKTKGADFALTWIVVRLLRTKEQFEAILRRADKTFQPNFSLNHPDIHVAFEADYSFKVEILQGVCLRYRQC